VDPVLTPREMGVIDRAAIATGVPQSTLMDRAGHAVAWAVRELLGATYGRRVLVACGPGNNGGDGRIAAQVLENWGVGVEVIDITDPAVDLEKLMSGPRPIDVVVDAMYGTGFRDDLDGIAADIADLTKSIPTVAVDIPSGVNGLTGLVTGKAVHGKVTVTFSARKPGLCFEPGRSLAGDIKVTDIGIAIGSSDLSTTTRTDVVDALRTCDSSSHDPAMHKWKSSLLVIGGSSGMVGAPILVSRAAMRTGAGLVWCAVPGHAAAARASGTEVIGVSLPATRRGAWRRVGSLHESLDRFRALVVGPGLGSARTTHRAVRALMTKVAAPVVLDADGLRAYAGRAELLRARLGPTVITPHAGEFAALTGNPIGADRVVAARALAHTTGATVLLKGPGTVVAEPLGRAAINPTDGPWLATAGSGDVLSGIIGGLLAQGLSPFMAAIAGAWLHSRAADVAGHTGMVAGDLVDALPRVLETLKPEEH